MLVLAVALAVVGLGIGPALVVLGRGRAVPSAAIEGLTLGLVPALIVLRILPHAYASLGVAAIALTAAGYALLWLADRLGHRAGARVGQAVIVPAIALHALMDGAALAVAIAEIGRGASSGFVLGAALLLHRLPEGLFLTTTLLPIVGWRRTLIRLGLVAVATIVGAWLGGTVLATVPDALVDAAVAIGLGVMMRLALHTHAPMPTERASRRASAAMFIAGIVLALALPAADDVMRRAQPRELSMTQTLVPLFIETAPALLGGLILSALFHALFPQRTTSWLRAGSQWQRALRGVLFGTARPWCACGVLPMVRRMLGEGIAPAAVLAFVLATPVLALDGLTLVCRLLGFPAMVWLCVAGVTVALAATRSMLAVAVLRPRHVALHVVGDDHLDPLPTSFAGRIAAGLREACGSALDQSGAWYLSGLVLAAALEAAGRSLFASRLGSPGDVVAVAIVAMPISIASQGAVPIAAVMLHKGFSIGAAIALLIVGPTVSIALAATVKRAFGPRTAVVGIAAVVALAVMAGVLANALIPARTIPAMHALVTHAHSLPEWLAAGLVAALLAASLLRVGPREWFGNMAIAGDEEMHGEHDHGHAHGHDHPPSSDPPYPVTVARPKP